MAGGVGLETGGQSETPSQSQRARHRLGVGAQPRRHLSFRFGAELSYVLTPAGREAGMRGTLVAGLLMAAALSTAAAANGPEIGRIKSVVGAASVARGKTIAAATPGELLEVGDVLWTGPDGRIGVTFVDNSRFAVGPNTRLALSQFEFDDTTHVGKFLTTIDRGSLAVVSGQIAHENKDAMRVRTPTSLLAARGTRFVVRVGS